MQHGFVPLPNQNAFRPSGIQEQKRLDIGNGMIQPSPDGTVQHEPPEAQGQSKLHRQHGVRIILLYRMPPDLTVLGDLPLRQGIKIPYQIIRLQPQRLCISVSTIGAEDQIPRLRGNGGQELHRCPGENITGQFFFNSHSFSPFASSNMRQ